MFRVYFLLCLWAVSNIGYSQVFVNDRCVTLSNSSCSMTMMLNGGALVDFHLTDNNCNPFTWSLPTEEMPINNRAGAPFRGHFLCTGRWGDPTPGEKAEGMPNNGPLSNGPWQVLSCQAMTVVMQCTSDLDYMVLNREVVLDKNNPVCKVKESLRSTATVGRLCNIVQHATMGPPFLSESTLVDANAGPGFMQHLSPLFPERYSYCWPAGIIDTLGTTVDLSRSDEPFSYVSTHLMQDSVAWVTVASPERGVLVGYVWSRADYPWLNIWHQWRDEKLWAKGVEFGTTGVGASYNDLLSTDTRFYGESSFFYLDAGETVQKSYICFLMPISKDYRGVASVFLDDEKIVVVEKGSSQRRSHVIDCSILK